ncbi:MAG: heme lyase CcmF/NrfE family subunit [Candidatus Neomarinimicrobiota bacterium]
MISQIGSIAISLAGGLIFSSFIFLGLFKKFKNQTYLQVAERAILATSYCIFLAFFCLLNELLISNFNLQYVAQYTSYETPVFYKITALWAGQAGSLLFWSFITAFFAVTYIFTTLEKLKTLKFHSYLILSFIFSFFILLSNFIANPFEPVSSDIIVQNGNGLNPLLQNFFMAIHPPILYVGFTGSAIIFIMALAASISKDISFEWVQSIRRWSLFVWTFLSAGIILGGYWAYNELGWGGYWAWDPVENSSLMPWLTLTAFIHSSMIQEKRGMLKKWNFLLATSTYILVILGTFITRSGVISSVHSFTAENLGPMFFAFLAILILYTVFWFFKRKSYLDTPDKIDSFTSREGGFLYNNLILILMCFTIMWGTLFPILSEAWDGNKIYVGASYFNQLNIPIGLVLLFLMGIGPLLSWNYTSKSILLNRFKLPLSISFLSGIGYMIFSSSFQIYVFVAIMGVSFTLSSILGEFYKSYKKQKKTSNFIHSLGKMFLSNRHKNGGYIVHIGIVLLFIGFIGRAFEVEKEFSLSPGEQIYFSNYVFKLNSIKSEARDNHYAFLSEIDVIDSSTNQLLVNLKPEKRIYFYWNSDPEKRQPHSELDIYSTIQKDIYSIFSGYDAQKNIGYFKIMINPLVNWVWIGGVLMVIGSLLAFWPSRRDN